MIEQGHDTTNSVPKARYYSVINFIYNLSPLGRQAEKYRRERELRNTCSVTVCWISSFRVALESNIPTPTRPRRC